MYQHILSSNYDGDANTRIVVKEDNMSKGLAGDEFFDKIISD